MSCHLPSTAFAVALSLFAGQAAAQAEQAAAEALLVASHDDAAAEVETVLVSGSRAELATQQTSAGVTGTELRERIFINTEDALRNLPDLAIRKRYVGDRNALIGGRSHGTLQAPRGVVYADGVLLSNFLGRFNAPRWNMVAPEEISRVDVLYGPFSALYPGNSIGTTVLITTRDPEEPTVSGRAQFFTQNYQDYGFEGDYAGRQYSVFGGSRLGERWRGSLGVNRLENRSQPMQYATGTLCTPNPNETPPKTCPSDGVAVTGAIADLDPRNQPRLILGPDGGSLEDDVQDQVKAKLGYENDLLRADLQAAFWRNEFDRHGVSFLRDAQGNTVTRGTIIANDRIYTVADSAFGPQHGIEEHLMYALTAGSKRESGWNVSTVASLYDITEDQVRASTLSSNGALNGTITDGGSGKGWWNVDVQARYDTPSLPHAFTIGYYHSRYDLSQQRYATGDWHNGARGTLLEGAEGATLMQALYAQDAWRIAEAWTATLGLRVERWEAYDGLRSKAMIDLPYDDRSEDSASPKLSILYAPGGYRLRYSVGRAVRYPTVSELFQGSIGTTTVGGTPQATIVNNDPNLKPEKSIAHELSWDTRVAQRHDLRVSLFHDDIDDTIHQQTNISVTPNVTSIQNVDRISTSGVELVYAAKDLLPRFDLDANLSLTRSKIESNDKVPTSEGKYWLRIPKLRANLVANWRFADDWNLNLSARHSGRQFNELDNSDTHSDVFGGASAFTTADLRLGWHFLDRFEIGAGAENITDEHYYIFHPYPGRTWVADIRGTF